MKENLNIKILDHYDTEKNIKKQKRKCYNSKSPISKSNNFTYIFNQLQHYYTPHKLNSQKQTFQFKSPKYKGIIQKKILERLDIYKKRNQAVKGVLQIQNKCNLQEKIEKSLKEKPQINQSSKIIYEKIKQKRNLSPNILQRFQTYKLEKSNRETKYQLIRNCSFSVKSNTMTCKNVLQSRNIIKQKSKSSKNIKLKEHKNQNESKFIKIIQKTDKSMKKRDFDRNSQLYDNFNNFNSFKQKKNTKQSKQSSFNFIYKQNNILNQSIQNFSVEYQSPFYKKKDNNKKWTVKLL